MQRAVHGNGCRPQLLLTVFLWYSVISLGFILPKNSRTYPNTESIIFLDSHEMVAQAISLHPNVTTELPSFLNYSTEIRNRPVGHG